MFDRTSNQELRNYRWIRSQNGNVPWNGNDKDAIFTLGTNFAKDHIYDLSMSAEPDANHDTDGNNIKLSGVQIASVPEPSSLLLLGSATAMLAAWR